MFSQKTWACVAPRMLLVVSLLITSCTTTQLHQQDSINIIQADLQDAYPAMALELDPADKSALLNQLRSQPLTPDIAVKIMLLNSPRVEVELHHLGVADAAQMQASLISNPHFGFSLLKPQQAGSWMWDLALTQPLLDWLNRPAREQHAAVEIKRSQLDFSRWLQINISELQQQYFATIAAQQDITTQNILMDAAKAKQQLAESLWKAGNISELQYLTYQSDYQQQVRELSRKQQQFIIKQNELAYLLGIDIGIETDMGVETGVENLRLPNELPSIISNDNWSLSIVIPEAVEHRLDIQLAQKTLVTLQQEEILIQHEYGIANTSVGIAAKRENGGVSNEGMTVETSIPLFDKGQAKARAVQANMAATHAEINNIRAKIKRDIIEANSKLEASKMDLVHVNNSQQTQERVLILAQREVNYMLRSPFDLIDIKTRSLELEQEKIKSLLNYWQAHCELELAVGHELTSGAHQHD